MSIALRQSANSASANHFSEATSAGSLLVCVVYATLNNPTAGPLSFSAPTTSGFSWTLVTNEQYNYLRVSTYDRGGVAVYYIADASAMADTITTTANVTSGAGSPSVSWNLYEFTGVATSSPLATDSANQNSSDTSSTIDPGSLVTSGTDLIFVSCTDSGASEGSGYTSGVTNNDQYILNKAAGTVATAFGSAVPTWAAVAVAFKNNITSANADPSGVKSDFAVGSPSTTAGSSVATTGVSASFTLGTAIPGGAVAFAEPSGVSMLSAFGLATAGVPINYGNVVSGSSGLPSGVNSTYFYVRWTGWLTVTVPGIYTLGLNIQDGGDFYVGTQPIVNALSASQTANTSTAYTNSGTVELAANIAYPIVIEWQHGSGADYECQLLWTPPDGSLAVIPPSYLSLTGKWWNGTSSSWFPQTWY